MTGAVVAAGIDLGGTKVETQGFDADWRVAARRRRPTPGDYAGLVAALAAEVAWAASLGAGVAVGVSAAGLVNPATGLCLTANLAATGRPLPADLGAAAGRGVAWVNDCRALTLSEAVLGAGRGRSPVAGVILGTGIGGGLAVRGRLVEGPTATGGEFGHLAAAASVVARHGLPLVACGCGRTGCCETLASGPGLLRIARAFGSGAGTPEEVVARRGSEAAAGRAWAAWVDVAAEMLLALAHVADPEVIVLGGGLSSVPGVAAELRAAMAQAQFAGFAVPDVVAAEGGGSSGARGAALVALGGRDG